MMEIMKTIRFWCVSAKSELAVTSMSIAPFNRNQAQFAS